MHKVLIHGSNIIDSLAVPIYQLWEEVQEADNKDFEWYRKTIQERAFVLTLILLYCITSYFCPDNYITSFKTNFMKAERPLLLEITECVSCVYSAVQNLNICLTNYNLSSNDSEELCLSNFHYIAQEKRNSLFTNEGPDVIRALKVFSCRNELPWRFKKKSNPNF